MTKKILILFSILLFLACVPEQNMLPLNYNILLTGASFATSINGWFELGCAELNATPINRAEGGESIINAANKMSAGVLYTPYELEKMDAFVIMHVQNYDVADESDLLDNYKDYTIPFNEGNYATAYDYVIKRYLSDCYELRNNPNSKYYRSQTGKPAVIVLCTHWHDARTTFNTSVRILAEKWGFPLVEFDKYIGFSKNTPNPVTKEQYSVMYSIDTQFIDDVEYGWHPLKGKDSYIQQRMSAIFADVIRKILIIQ